MAIINLDGTKIKLEQPDLDGDGKTGGIEHIKINKNIEAITQPTELGESLKELNDDTINSENRMSGIDMRSRLHHTEVSSVLALDALVALGICPSNMLSFTRQKKRLSVSIDGHGRKEIVEIVGGKRENDNKKGFGEGFKNFLGFGNGKE